MSAQNSIPLYKQIQWLDKHLQNISDAIVSEYSDGSIILLDLIEEESNFKAILESLKRLKELGG